MKSARVYSMGRALDEDSIQKGIPIPPKQNGPVSKYRARMALLEIGDSFFVAQGSRHGAAGHAKALGIRIETRTIGNGIRIWRVA